MASSANSSDRRQAPPVYRRTSTASLDNGKQMIRGGIYGIKTPESFTLPASSFDENGSLEVLLSTTTSLTLSAAATSSTAPVTATSPTASAAATSITLQVTATSFTLAATANSHNKDSPEAKFKCDVAKISGIKLETKQLKRRWEQIDIHKGDRGRSVSRLQSTPFRHKRIKQRVEKYVLPDDDVAYSSRAVTHLSEVGVARSSFSDGQHHNLPLARRRMLCQQC